MRHAPALTIVPHHHDEQLLLDTKALLAAPPDAVVVTTGIGFRGWVEAADAAGLADDLLDVLGRARIIARGPKARGAIQAAGLQADWVAESETSAEILEILLSEGVAGQRVAIQHHGAGADGLDSELAAAGADVASLVVYRWGPPPDPDALRASVLARRPATSTPWCSRRRRGLTRGCRPSMSAACRPGAGPPAGRPHGGRRRRPVTAKPLQDRGVEPDRPGARPSRRPRARARGPLRRGRHRRGRDRGRSRCRCGAPWRCSMAM